MRNEIDAAAKFLANLLKLHSNVLSADQLAKFQGAIEDHLADHYVDHWFPEKPNKGSAYRCIRINHKMDPIISKAGSSCGLDQSQLRTIFPNELTLWIDPREVSYRIGENGSICVLFDTAENGGVVTKATALSNNKASVKDKLSTSPQGRSMIGHLAKNGMKLVSHADSYHHHQAQSQHHHHMTPRQQQHNSHRGSPTDTSSLSSTTSTMSSPSPSSSPDWCRSQTLTNGHSDGGHHQQQHHQVQQQHRRSSPISGGSYHQQQQASHHHIGGPAGTNFHAAQDLFGSVQSSGSYLFNSGVVNASSRQLQNGAHQQQQHFGGFGSSHGGSSSGTWGSPSRDSPNNWAVHNANYQGAPVSRRSNHSQVNHSSPMSSGHGYNAWTDSVIVTNGPQSGHAQHTSANGSGWFDSPIGGRGHGHGVHQSHHSHMNLSANLEQVAAYVSS
ncbi:Protein BTG2 [Halotydeus destructor]|nr:Protein BTG2 [Halotydeus destructor]